MERSQERYNLSSYQKDNITMNDMVIDMDLEGSHKGSVIDISLKGVGFEFTGLDDELIEKIRSADEVFIKLYWGKIFLLIGAKLAWGVKKANGNGGVFKGGFEISVISPEDNIRLSELIRDIRASAQR